MQNLDRLRNHICWKVSKIGRNYCPCTGHNGGRQNVFVIRIRQSKCVLKSFPTSDLRVIECVAHLGDEIACSVVGPTLLLAPSYELRRLMLLKFFEDRTAPDGAIHSFDSEGQEEISL